MRRNDALHALWAYLIEILLVGLLYALLATTVGGDQVVTFIKRTSKAWESITVALLTGSIALWIAVLVNIGRTKFGRYLRDRKAASLYLCAFGFTTFVFLATRLSLSWADDSGSRVVLMITAPLILYSSVNLITMLKNAWNSCPCTAFSSALNQRLYQQKNRQV